MSLWSNIIKNKDKRKRYYQESSLFPMCDRKISPALTVVTFGHETAGKDYLR